MLNTRCLMVVFMIIASMTDAKNNQEVLEIPSNFVDASKIIPQLQIDMRYYGNHNFIGRRIVGYEAPKCLLTKDAAKSLKQVEDKLLPLGLTLKVYDCYRPQMAVNEFVSWGHDIKDNKMKPEFYPTLNKKNVFSLGYVATKSAHSRGSTVDLTIVPLNSHIYEYKPEDKLISCMSKNRFLDNSLDFGSGFDCFDLISHPDNLGVNFQARANRLLLQTLMKDAGFDGIKEEWWHFTLKNEPYPTTYFNFVIK